MPAYYYVGDPFIIVGGCETGGVGKGDGSSDGSGVAVGPGLAIAEGAIWARDDGVAVELRFVVPF